ncbi:MAG: hypothetical protein K8F92_20415 [Hyphomicrobium sp.]|uniref:AAA domain-containing protein n=1 Tax=Hyphomicrobium sp. TaxID=82 RepID=UPI001328C922|nr:AAA domain-containing protein [Hyphomicrobium sp.]KAB2941350.1 MAG: hypothetical protein F9K20_09605 [Hyphomicrobium sp.]MBZ0211998.1 hypothetical protein [Hyphomicrobium sp.]
MNARRASKRGFLADYAPDESFLLKPDRTLGRPGILRARDPQGNDVLVKHWPRNKSVDDADLEDIWRSELRQLHRLAALPRAEELFVPVRASGKDDKGFYLVLDPGQASPLDTFLNAARKPEILARARLPRSRHLLWSNARRLVEGLELLHSQGAIHRNLDTFAVVTALTPEPDFRITGFEWSMRIASSGAPKGKKKTPPRGKETVSFAHDWRDLALLIARLLDIPADKLADYKIPPSDVAEHASAAEVRLLRIMLGVEKVERLDGPFISSVLDPILDSIESEVARRDARYCLALRFGPESQLSQAIRTASGKQIETSDGEQQLRFVADDLGAQPLFQTLRDGNRQRHVLVGKQLTYRINPYRQQRTDEEPTWEFAFCDRADDAIPTQGAIIGSTACTNAALELVPLNVAVQSFPRRRGKVQNWTDLLSKTSTPSKDKTDLDRMHQSLAVLLILEMAYAAADIFPVQVVKSPEPAGGDTYALHVASRNDPDRAKLSQRLQLDAPAQRLAKMLDGDEVREEGGWILAEAHMLGDKVPTATTWRYIGRKDVNGQPCLRLEGQTAVVPTGDVFLTPAGMTGRIAQFKRRLNALTALRQHTELLGMLADPRARIYDTHDPLDENDARFKALDGSKQAALREILSTIPLFLLQGPPGVGKTYLAGDVVQRRFEDEATSRLLLSAQSNAAIDHLMNEVKGVFQALPADQRPLIVRARSVDDDESAGDHEIDVQADNYLRSLADSDLVDEAPAHLRDRIRGLATAYKTVDHASTDPLMRRTSSEVRAFEGMILRAANLVFATTNSHAVARLIEEKSLFDWSIVEEAGKATGGELLSPLLLSHRRLMIGDHKQLPPFDVDKIGKLLLSPKKVREAVLLADNLISRYLKEPGIDEIYREVQKETELEHVCASTLNVLSLFETLIEQELRRQNGGRGRPIARRLNEQYRMHPAIARVVSHCFYDKELITNDKTARKYAETPPPFASTDPKRLPDLPIVFIDMPYSRADKPGAKSGERAPPWSNPDEARVAMTALRMLRPTPGASSPSLAILSPYRQQVKLLRQKLASYHDGGSLPDLKAFLPAIGEGEYCGTVDSFQGSEADLVLISLVRNNHLSTPSAALGFLRDVRRMNVLLSRAKWRMVLIGSLDFYRHVVTTAEALPDQDVGFLKKFLEALEAAVRDKDAAVMSLSTLEGKRG